MTYDFMSCCVNASWVRCDQGLKVKPEIQVNHYLHEIKSRMFTSQCRGGAICDGGGWTQSMVRFGDMLIVKVSWETFFCINM